MSAQPNFANVCLTDAQLLVHGTPLEYNLQRYIYPALAIFGILGNTLNLTVLLNKSMRSRSNTFLSVLAFADIIFLALLLPNIMANYRMFALSITFRKFYFPIKVHLISLANWCSAVAIWCVIAVCTDRLIGIKSPLYARSNWSSWKLPAIIIGIVIISGCVTFYQHFEYECRTRNWFKHEVNPYSHTYRQTLSALFLVYVTLMIIFPIFVLAVLNILLLCALRQRHRDFELMNKNDRRTNESQLQKTENRVTITVAFIVTMFTLTNGPSALVHLAKATYSWDEQAVYDATMVCSTLVICGKASNFILFCLGSKHFRIRLMRLTQKKVNKKIGSMPSLQASLRSLMVIAQFFRFRSFRKQSALPSDSHLPRLCRFFGRNSSSGIGQQSDRSQKTKRSFPEKQYFSGTHSGWSSIADAQHWRTLQTTFDESQTLVANVDYTPRD